MTRPASLPKATALPRVLPAVFQAEYAASLASGSGWSMAHSRRSAPLG